MEASSLIKAHDHARAASTATQMSDTTVAVNEHALAAGEFANAAKCTNSVEALRTLKLLEQHHQRLSELLKVPFEHHAQSGSSSSAEKATTTGDAALDPPKSESSGGNTPSKTATVPSLTQQRRYPSRDLTSSIASNLASARGIRAKYRVQPLSPSVSNDQAPGNMENHLRREGSRSKMQNMLDQSHAGKIPPPVAPLRDDSRVKDTETQKKPEDTTTSSEEGYSRFYNTFGSLINKLSAPLAFAGLPLIVEESPSELLDASDSANKRNRNKAPQTVSSEPDWSKNYSRATLRSLRRDGHTATDSFYVVPPSGHTASYASILSFADKEKRRMEASHHGDADLIEDDEDDFVDARETPVPLSPGAKRRVGRGRTEKDLNNTIEELYLENKSLKDMLDKLSKRLHAFEASAQNSSLALAESIRLIRPGSPMSSGSGHRAPADDVLRKKNQELEEELTMAVQRIELLEKDNRKMQKIVEKYREKWEKLKASAKARREAQGAVENIEDEAGHS